MKKEQVIQPVTIEKPYPKEGLCFQCGRPTPPKDLYGEDKKKVCINCLRLKKGS